MRFCPDCGAEADDGDSFCRECGAKLPDEQWDDPPGAFESDEPEPKRERPLGLTVVAALFGFGAVSSLPIVAAGGAATVAGLVAASTQGAAGYGVFRLRRWGLYLALIISALSLLGGILLFSVPIPESMPLALTDEEVTAAAVLNILQGGLVGAYLLYRRDYF